MRLRLIREPSHGKTTLGALYVDDVWVCWTLEDELREVPGQPVSAWKVYGQTAIPAGRYAVRVSWSPRFQRQLPELVDVPGFSFIRLHPGNTHEHSEGCILVGFRRANAVIHESRLALDYVMTRLLDAGGQAALTIENPPGYHPVLDN